MISTLSKQGGRRYPQLRSTPGQVSSARAVGALTPPTPPPPTPTAAGTNTLEYLSGSNGFVPQFTPMMRERKRKRRQFVLAVLAALGEI